MINHASSERLKVHVYVHQGISATSIKHIVVRNQKNRCLVDMKALTWFKKYLFNIWNPQTEQWNAILWFILVWCIHIYNFVRRNFAIFMMATFKTGINQKRSDLLILFSFKHMYYNRSQIIHEEQTLQVLNQTW